METSAARNQIHPQHPIVCRIGGRTESERVSNHTVHKIRQRTAAKPDGRFKGLGHSRRAAADDDKNNIDAYVRHVKRLHAIVLAFRIVGETL